MKLFDQSLLYPQDTPSSNGWRMDLHLRDQPDRTLSFKRVRELTDLSRTTVWRMQKVGQFPLPIQISPGRVGWLESEVLAWRQGRARGDLPFVAKPRRPVLAASGVADAPDTASEPELVSRGVGQIGPALAGPGPTGRSTRVRPEQLGFAF